MDFLKERCFFIGNFSGFIEFLRKNQNFKYFFKKSQKFLWNKSDLDFFDKMDYLARKMIYLWKMNSFSNTLNRFTKWNFTTVRGALTPGPPALAPCEPLPLDSPPRTKLLEPLVVSELATQTNWLDRLDIVIKTTKSYTAVLFRKFSSPFVCVTMQHPMPSSEWTCL